MAAFPNVRVGVGSTMSYDTDLQVTRASNGAARGRVFYASAKPRFKLELPALDAADLDTFEAFYLAAISGDAPFASPLEAFDFTWADGVVRSCIFTSDPAYKRIAGGLTTVSIDIAEV